MSELQVILAVSLLDLAEIPVVIVAHLTDPPVSS